MKRFIRCLLMIVLVTSLLVAQPIHAANEELPVSAPSVILVEASTGKTIYEKNAKEHLSPASITKIMTLLLTFEALDQGKIHLEDQVTTSAHAKSMGGSQVFLEEGEVQTVDALLKCIAVASGNDASVAMAEHIAGSEEEFVKQMNQEAARLHMEDTHFEDCCGLSVSTTHYTTASDVAIMSRELITKYPHIYDYTKIWMEDITHTTAKGSSSFTLASTNKLLKQYQWTTGLKTGSTSVAKYCLSATAHKDKIDLIAVVMAAPDFKVRFQDAIILLNYGFRVSNLYEDKNEKKLPDQAVERGVQQQVPITYETEFRYLDITGADLTKIEKKIALKDKAIAPIQKGDIAGEAVYQLNGARIGSVPILYGADVAKATYRDYWMQAMQWYLL
ncbi:MAG: D-alanyl-D-alanine carboxypeptidase family protein [Lachnospiraceae bacterium]